jgi:dUTP pyrophosphatase
MSRIAYLATPIDQAPDRPEWNKVVEQMKAILTAHDYCVYTPAAAWRTRSYSQPHPAVEVINRGALHQADLMVAYLPAGVASIGIPMEIEQATQLGIPVVVVSDVRSYVLERPGVYRVEGVPDGEFDTILHELDGIPWGVRPRPERHALKLVIHDGHEPPKRAYADDAGVDLTCVQDYEVLPGQFVDVRTQVDAVQLPDGYWGLITGRSSALRRWNLHVPVGVIDPGWRGPLFVGIWNLSPEPIIITAGVRLGQLILLPNNPAPVLAVDKVDDAPRGVSGFGSTG